MKLGRDESQPRVHTETSLQQIWHKEQVELLVGTLKTLKHILFGLQKFFGFYLFFFLVGCLKCFLNPQAENLF